MKPDKQKNSITIFIKNQNGEIIKLKSEINNYIKDIRPQITKQFFSDYKFIFAPNQQILTFNGKILEDNKTLSYYDIKNKSTISLEINMNIFVEIDDGKIIILKVKPYDTIDNIKKIIADQENITMNQLNNIFFSYFYIKNDGESLSSYQIQNNSILKLKNKKERKKIVYLKKFLGQTTYKILVPDFLIFVDEFKEYIQEDIGLPTHQQKLIFHGKLLSDDKTLIEYNINNEATIYLMHY